MTLYRFGLRKRIPVCFRLLSWRQFSLTGLVCLTDTANTLTRLAPHDGIEPSLKYRTVLVAYGVSHVRQT